MEPLRAVTPSVRTAVCPARDNQARAARPLGQSAGLAVALLAVATLGMGCRKWPHLAEETHAAALPAVSEARFPTTINHSYGLLGVTTARKDVLGKPARIPCVTCHSRDPLKNGKPENTEAKEIPGFHGGIQLNHGGQACRTCHQVPGFDAFNLASGQRVSYLQVIDLCGQCHARRVAEYKRGIHGGMNGYWDLSRGPRNRNLCIDCHNAHSPAIGPVMPAPRHRPRPGL